MVVKQSSSAGKGAAPSGMERALALARGVAHTTSPNPPVGAVLVQDGSVVGEGATQPPGKAHAEVVALQQAGEAARGATLYVSLEPHNFHGRTPPCTDAIIAAGVADVVIGTLDPNPRVAGKGKAALEAAGIATHMATGEDAAAAEELIEAHAKWSTTGLPLVVVKFAMTLDGKIATVTGQSQWISGEESRRHAQALRRTSDAIMVGVNTALRDNPQLTARNAAGKAFAKQPMRVIVDSKGRLPASAKMLKEPGSTLVATAKVSTTKKSTLTRAGAEVFPAPSRSGRVDLKALLKALGKREVTSVLVEGGGTLLASLFEAKRVAKVYAYIAPRIVGGKTALTPVEGKGIAQLNNAVQLERVRVEKTGNDILIMGYPRQGKTQ